MEGMLKNSWVNIAPCQSIYTLMLFLFSYVVLSPKPLYACLFYTFMKPPWMTALNCTSLGLWIPTGPEVKNSCQQCFQGWETPDTSSWRKAAWKNLFTDHRDVRSYRHESFPIPLLYKVWQLLKPKPSSDSDASVDFPPRQFPPTLQMAVLQSF